MEKLLVKNRNLEDDTTEARTSGVLPAVMYGRDTESTPIAINMNDFIKLWHHTGTSTVFELEMEDGTVKPALLQEIDLHPVTDLPLHADIYVIKKGQTVTVDLPIELVGAAPAIKNKGGLLVHVLHTVEVEADPTKLPPHLEIDLSILTDIGSQATVGDIVKIEGVEILAEDEEVIVLVEEPTELEEIEPDEEADEFNLDDIEVEGEKPKTEEGEEGEGDESEEGEQKDEE